MLLFSKQSGIWWEMHSELKILDGSSLCLLGAPIQVSGSF